MHKLRANYSGLNTKRPVPEAAARADTCLSPNLTEHSERLVLLHLIPFHHQPDLLLAA